MVMDRVWLQYLKLDHVTAVVKTEYLTTYTFPSNLKATVIKEVPTDYMTIVSIDFKVNWTFHCKVNWSEQPWISKPVFIKAFTT